MVSHLNLDLSEGLKKWIPALDEPCLPVVNDQKGLFSSPAKTIICFIKHNNIVLLDEHTCITRSAKEHISCSPFLQTVSRGWAWLYMFTLGIKSLVHGYQYRMVLFLDTLFVLDSCI